MFTMSFTISGNCCVYAECKNTRRATPKLSFYTFPVKSKARCQIWIENSGNPKLFEINDDKVLQKKAICEQHFLPSAFRDFRALKKFLNINAVPVKYERKEIEKDRCSTTKVTSVLPVKYTYSKGKYTGWKFTSYA